MVPVKPLPKPTCDEDHDDIFGAGYSEGATYGCERHHPEDWIPFLQDVYEHVTGTIADWTKDCTEPWWSLSGALHGQTV